MTCFGDADAGIEAEAASAVESRGAAIERIRVAGQAGGRIGSVVVGAALFFAFVIALRSMRGAR